MSTSLLLGTLWFSSASQICALLEALLSLNRVWLHIRLCLWMPQQEIFIVLFDACWETDLFFTKSSIKTCSHYRKAFFSFGYFPSVIAKISLDTSLGVKSCLSARGKKKKTLNKMSTLIFIYIITMFACLHSFNKFIGDLFYHTFPYAVGHFWFPFIADKKLRVKKYH